jgi:hypothetical protein
VAGTTYDSDWSYRDQITQCYYHLSVLPPRQCQINFSKIKSSPSSADDPELQKLDEQLDKQPKPDKQLEKLEKKKEPKKEKKGGSIPKSKSEMKEAMGKLEADPEIKAMLKKDPSLKKVM